MITLTTDKLPSIGVDFPMKGLIHQEPGPSAPMQVASPGDLAPPGEQAKARADLYSATR
jgi:hypothetical protein